MATPVEAFKEEAARAAQQYSSREVARLHNKLVGMRQMAYLGESDSWSESPDATMLVGFPSGLVIPIEMHRFQYRHGGLLSKPRLTAVDRFIIPINDQTLPDDPQLRDEFLWGYRNRERVRNSYDASLILDVKPSQANETLYRASIDYFERSGTPLGYLRYLNGNVASYDDLKHEYRLRAKHRIRPVSKHQYGSLLLDRIARTFEGEPGRVVMDSYPSQNVKDGKALTSLT